MNQYIKMNVEENEEEDEKNECIFCFEICNDVLYTYCKKCKNIFHKNCFDKWVNKCKSNNNKNYLKCIYCQNRNCIYKIKQFCCKYYSEKIQ